MLFISVFSNLSLISVLSFSDYNAEEQDIRPLKIIPVSNVTCVKNLKAFNYYVQDVFYVKTNFTDREALEISHEESNYNFSALPSATVGKLVDVIVDPIAFKKAVIQAKPAYSDKS